MSTTNLTATFRVVTPMFLGGAEPTKEAELRVSSIKGALRFWWRALQWGKVMDVAELRRKEACLFGSSDVGQSKFIMRIEMPTSSVLLRPGELLERTGTKAASQRNAIVGEGARYLGYGLMEAFDGRNSVGGRLTRSCFAAPLEFKLHVTLKATDDDTQQAEVLSALKLLGLCGGVGSRARRGYGSVSLVSLQKGEAVIWSSPTDSAEWVGELKAALGELPQAQGIPEWTSFSQNYSKALILSPIQISSLELLARMGRDFVFFRSWGRDGRVLGQNSEKRFEDDHDLMKTPANGRTRHPRRIAFGLPHNYGKRADEQVEPEDDKLDRRASSLFFHIHQPMAQQAPLGILLFLPSRFLPNGRDNICVGGKTVPLAHGGTGEFWQPVQDFLERLHTGSGKEHFNAARLIHL